MLNLIFSYLFVGFILAATNDILILPKFAENHPDGSFLYTKLRYRILIALIIIIGWLPYQIIYWIMSMMHKESDQ